MLTPNSSCSVSYTHLLGNILPSRLVKRLVTTLISHFDAGDPWLNERLFYNETLASFLRSQTLQKALGRLPDGLSAEMCIRDRPNASRPTSSPSCSR